ncbi:FBP domain-containing protein [Pimelobacter sp. 30-1]|uniref:FBP domain-containing protein n=1 Tax=Pimelobacter sp. 30-1 TaxID=2004991 RepID=UPI001C053ACA|nr:FBP domain-containing protein [Pimelobacter sp. 30-1]MBU2694386.1 hypothetical protein [Pimelobacter sp. 30-1]
MNPLTEREIRASFVNCSKGEAARLHVPRDLAERPWGDLDYLGWRDPQSRTRGHLVTRYDDRLVGAVLRAPEAGVGARRSMCSLCMTVQSGGVALWVAPRAGKAGKQGHSVGTYVCANLSCSLTVRGKLSTDSPGMFETLSTEQRVARLDTNLRAFVGRVLRD